MKFKTMAEVAVMLRKAREKRKLGLREAARKAGISAAQLSKLEAGETENPTMVTIVRLSPVLGLKPHQWFY
jgi:transcriptional regulator with XRE-family HTH domain